LDRYKIENLRRISKRNYDEVEIQNKAARSLFDVADFMCEAESQEEQMARKKKNEDQDAKFDSKELQEKKEQLLYAGRMFKCHKCWYRVKDNYSHKRLFMVLTAMVIYAMWILPMQLYAFNVIDRHYLGWFDQREPLIAVTTAQSGYFISHGIPFIDYDDLQKQRTQYHLDVAAGKEPFAHKMADYSLHRVMGRFLSSRNNTGQNDEVVNTTPAAIPLTQLLKEKHRPEGHREL